MKKFINYKYVLDELVENMSKAIDQSNKVIKETGEFIEFIKKYDKEEKFKNIISSFDEQTTHYKEQVRIMTYRVELAKEILKELDDKNYLHLACMIFEVLGVANKDAKTLLEREKNKEDIIEC